MIRYDAAFPTAIPPRLDTSAPQTPPQTPDALGQIPVAYTPHLLQLWEASLRQPATDIDLIVTLAPRSNGFPLDRVARALLREGTIVGFVPVYANDEIATFQRADEAVGSQPQRRTSPEDR